MKAWLLAGLCLVLAAGCRKPAPAPVGERRVRRPVVAGSWYPGEAGALAREVRGHLAAAPRVAGAKVRMVLSPHAGFAFSGPIAGAAFRQLDPGFERAVVVAANHSRDASYAGLSPDRATHYAMPGFEVKVARAAHDLVGSPGFPEVPAAHGTHVVEIVLPFLEQVNGAPFELVPLIAGSMTREQTRAFAGKLAELADGKTVFVFSVDLSHFHAWEVAVARDRPCLDALARADADAIADCDTDGTQVLLVMTELAAALQLTPRPVAYANSGDVSGDRSRVVGYGALAYEERFELNPEEGAALAVLARGAVETAVRDGRRLEVPEELGWRWPRLLARRGAFVTLRKQGELRGCIGSLEAVSPLALDVVGNALNAAVRDPRFPKVSPAELEEIAVTVSVLEAARPVEGLLGEELLRHLGQKRPGLIIDYRGRRSTFLPEIWEQVPEPAAFLGHLCAKQGAPADCWSRPEARLQSYGVQHFGEPRAAAGAATAPGR